MANPVRRSFLDRPIARVIALLIFLACIGAILWFERARLFGLEAASDGPFARCYAERSAEIDRMLDEGMIGEEQATLFKQRAEAMCRAEAGGDSGLPVLPGQ